MPLFLSTTTNKVDRKGRVSVPAAFRAALPRGGFQGVVVYESFKHACINGSDLGFMEDLSDNIHGDFGLFSDGNEALANAILASARQLPFDPEGRVVLPKELIQHAGISGEATFVGLGKTFQIWAPDEYQTHRTEQRARAEQEALNLTPVVRRPDGGGR